MNKLTLNEPAKIYYTLTFLSEGSHHVRFIRFIFYSSSLSSLVPSPISGDDIQLYVRSLNNFIDAECLVYTKYFPTEKSLRSAKSLLPAKSLPVI